MKKFIKQIITLAAFVAVIGFGASLTMKAALGIGAYDALSMSLSKAFFIKVGTIGMCTNITCIIMQLIILKKKFKLMQFLQVGVSVLVGIAINFSFYNVLGGIAVSNYILKLILLVTGYVICAIAVAVVMTINLVSMPLEGFCLVLADKFKLNFGRVRQAADIIFIAIVIIITLIFKTEITLREGTIIGMLIYGPMLHKFMNIIKPILVKFDVVAFTENQSETDKRSKVIEI